MALLAFVGERCQDDSMMGHCLSRRLSLKVFGDMS